MKDALHQLFPKFQEYALTVFFGLKFYHNSKLNVCADLK
jgi:hypothetical protein